MLPISGRPKGTIELPKSEKLTVPWFVNWPGILR